MTTNSRILLGLTALLAVGLLAGCASNGGDTTKPADIKTAIKGTPLPPDQMAKIEAASAAQGQATQAKAQAAAANHPTGPPQPGH